MKHFIFCIILSGSLMLTSCSFTSVDDSSDKLHLLWQYSYQNTDGSDPNTLPLILDNQSIITSGDPSVTSLDIRDGSLNWRSPFNYESSLRNRKFEIKGNIVTGTIPRKVMAWDKHTGDQIWSVTIPESLSWNFGKSEITSGGNRFVVPGLSNYFYSISKQGALEIKQVDISIMRTTIVDNTIYISQRKDNNLAVVSAYDLESMELIWRYDQDEIGYLADLPPILDERVLYLFFFGANLTVPGIVALNPENGEIIWIQSDFSPSDAIIIDENIYVASGVYVWALNKHTGELLWRTIKPMSGLRTGNLAYLEGYVYAAYTQGLRVIEAKTGETVLFMESDYENSFRRLAAGAGRIFAQSNRHLYAFAPWGHKEALEL